MSKEYLLNILNSDIVNEGLNDAILLNDISQEDIKLYKEIAIIFFQRVPEHLEVMDVVSIFTTAIEDYNSSYTTHDEFGTIVEKNQQESFLKSLIYSYNTNYVGRLNPEEMLNEKDFLDIETNYFPKQ